MTTSLKMCCEPRCEEILVDVANDKWIGKENKSYQGEINAADGITYGYCPKHLEDNSSQRQLVEIRRMRAVGLI